MAGDSGQLGTGLGFGFLEHVSRKNATGDLS